jgi:pimeloyl-ACP methyl ester carboxylesterase
LGQPVVLLHGLLMRRPALLPMAWRLRQRGFSPLLFTYSSLWSAPEQAIERLAARLREISASAGPVHVVGHSLGGLIAAQTLRQHPDLAIGRVVFLGSPIAGSAAARGLAGKGFGLVSGRSGPFLREGLGELPAGREIGMVAGTRSVGLGKLFGRFGEDNDGTVALSETQLPGLSGHVSIPASHTGLIVSSLAARLSADFLETGHFQA